MTKRNVTLDVVVHEDGLVRNCPSGFIVKTCRPTTLGQVYDAIESEMRYVDGNVTPTRRYAGTYEPGAWFTWIRCYMRKAEDQITDKRRYGDAWLHTVRKLATFFVRIMLEHGALTRGEEEAAKNTTPGPGIVQALQQDKLSYGKL